MRLNKTKDETSYALKNSKAHTGEPRQPYAFSPSTVKMYQQCPLKFRYYAIDKIPSKPSIAKEKGTLVHAVLEKLFDSAPQARTYQQATIILEETWQNMIADNKELSLLLFNRDQQAETEFLTAAKELLANYFRLEYPMNLEAYATEMYLRTDTESGLNIHGFADRVEKNATGMVRIVDYKTGKSPKPQYQREYRFQMIFYALMWWRMYQEIPALLQLLFLADARSLSYHPRLEDLFHLQTEIEQTWKSVEYALCKKNFTPRKNPLCNWCDYQKICPLFGGMSPEYPDSAASHLLSVTEKI